MIKIKQTPLSKKVVAEISKLDGVHKESIRLALHDIGQMVGLEIKRLIETGPKTGVHYRKLPNRSSDDYQSPANQFGKLVKSYSYKVSSWNSMRVGESAEYAGFLEDGTRKMKPRPHVGRAINNKMGDTIEMLYRRANEQLRK